MSVEAQVTHAQISESKSSVGIFELPCGYLDATGVLHTEVEVREITGAEEDMLASKSVPPARKMGELITRCLTRVGMITEPVKMHEVTQSLPVGDRVYLIFALRRVTFGDEYSFQDECPSEDCKRKSLYSIDLSTLEKKDMPDRMKRVFTAKLPSGKDVTYRTMYGADEERVAKFSRTDDAISQTMLLRLEMLAGEPPTLKSVKALGMKDRQAIRALFEAVDGGVDTTVEMECPVCGHAFERELDIGHPSFFFPSVTPSH